MNKLCPACLLCALVLQLAACERPADTARSGGMLAAPLSNPWAVADAAPAPAPEPPPDISLPSHAAVSARLLQALASRDPNTRMDAMEAWRLSRPDSLHEISPMLHDPDPSVRTRARALWTAALSGGRKADPE